MDEVLVPAGAGPLALAVAAAAVEPASAAFDPPGSTPFRVAATSLPTGASALCLPFARVVGGGGEIGGGPHFSTADVHGVGGAGVQGVGGARIVVPDEVDKGSLLAGSAVEDDEAA